MIEWQAVLTGTVLTGAVLTGTVLTEAVLTGAVLTGTVSVVMQLEVFSFGMQFGVVAVTDPHGAPWPGCNVVRHAW